MVEPFGDDLDVNATKEKKLTNFRSSTAEELLSGLTELCDAVASDLSAPWPGEG